MNIEKKISDFNDDLKNKKNSERSDFIIEFISHNAFYFQQILSTVIFKTNLPEDIHTLVNNKYTKNLLTEHKIEKNLYFQEFYIIKILHDAKLYDINKYTSTLINRAFNEEENLDLLKYILENINEPFEFKDNHMFVSPILSNDKELLNIFLSSNKIIINKTFLTLLTSTLEMNNNEMVSWLLEYDKIYSLCNSKWINSIQNEKHKKIIKTIFSIKNF